MKSWSREVLVAFVAASIAFLLFGWLVGFDYALSFWYVPLLASLATGSIVHIFRRQAAQSTD